MREVADWANWFNEFEIDAWLRQRRYQGAIVNIWNRGLFVSDAALENLVYNIDVSGMYPSVMIMTNISSENTRVINRQPFTGKYNFDAGNGTLEVPDTYLGQVTVEVDEADSITRVEMLKFRALRNEFKKLPQTPENDGAQKGIKIIMNATYGYHGLDFSRYGSFPVALVTTAVGRYIMGEIIAKSDEAKLTKLLCDTDGLYNYGHVITDEVNDHLHEVFADYKYNHVIGVEPKLYGGIIISRMKNYVLKTVDGAVKFKGSSFHGRHMPRICRTALHAFATAIFEHTEISDVWRAFHDLRSYSLRQFTMSVKMNKEPSQYDEHTMYADLAKKLGVDNVQWGQDIYYVKIRDGYMPLGVVDDAKLKRLIDYSYYRNRVRDVGKRLLRAANDVSIVQVRKGGRKRLADRTKLSEFM